VWDVIYSPFGETSYIWTNPGTIDIRFPGQWFQLESGLAYNWHRHYDATLGRYVQPDPLGLTALLSDGPSAYGYVGQNPLSFVDPTGKIAFAPAIWMGGEIAVGAIIRWAGRATVAALAATLSGDTADNMCDDDNKRKDCSLASKFQLRQAQIFSEHEFKEEYSAVPVSRFDICACKNGEIVIRLHGQCGNSGPTITTYARWK
jgi:RHS repeat-associated protein